MIQEIGDKKFDNQYTDGMVPQAEDYVFVFQKADQGPDLVLLGEAEDAGVRIPTVGDLFGGQEAASVQIGTLIYLFSIDDEKFYLMPQGRGVAVHIPAGFEFQSTRVLRKQNPKYLCFAAMTAMHLNQWYKDNRFCGRCGAKTEHAPKLRAMRCPKCGNLIFPRINPAVTVALRHEDKLLVSKYRGRTQTSMYALIAGFVEIGESAEECVAREVMEEVGLKAVNVKYYGSQPWGFAGNLQIGYTAEVEGSTEIILDEEELSNAFFIGRDELDHNPNQPALTQEMIEQFRIGNL